MGFELTEFPVGVSDPLLMYSSDCGVERHDATCGLDGAHRQRLARRADTASPGRALVLPLVLGALGPRELQPVFRTYPGDGVLQRSSTRWHWRYHLPNTARGQRTDTSSHCCTNSQDIKQVLHIIFGMGFVFFCIFDFYQGQLQNQHWNLCKKTNLWVILHNTTVLWVLLKPWRLKSIVTILQVRVENWRIIRNVIQKKIQTWFWIAFFTLNNLWECKITWQKFKWKNITKNLNKYIFQILK